MPPLEDTLPNKRQVVLNDDEINRRLAIKNNERMNRDFAPMWREKQLRTYHNLLQMTNQEPLANVITEETQRIYDNPQVLFNNLFNALLKFSDARSAQAILQNLTLEEQKFLYSQFPNIVKTMRNEKVTSIDVNQFVQAIKTGTAQGRVLQRGTEPQTRRPGPDNDGGNDDSSDDDDDDDDDDNSSDEDDSNGNFFDVQQGDADDMDDDWTDTFGYQNESKSSSSVPGPFMSSLLNQRKERPTPASPPTDMYDPFAGVAGLTPQERREGLRRMVDNTNVQPAARMREDYMPRAPSEQRPQPDNSRRPMVPDLRGIPQSIFRSAPVNPSEAQALRNSGAFISPAPQSLPRNTIRGSETIQYVPLSYPSEQTPQEQQILRSNPPTTQTEGPFMSSLRTKRDRSPENSTEGPFMSSLRREFVVTGITQQERVAENTNRREIEQALRDAGNQGAPTEPGNTHVDREPPRNILGQKHKRDLPSREVEQPRGRRRAEIPPELENLLVRRGRPDEPVRRNVRRRRNPPEIAPVPPVPRPDNLSGRRRSRNEAIPYNSQIRVPAPTVLRRLNPAEQQAQANAEANLVNTASRRATLRPASRPTPPPPLSAALVAPAPASYPAVPILPGIRPGVINNLRYGRGLTPRSTTKRQYINGKYYIDLNKLNDNVLCVKYSTNDAQLPHVKVERISNKAKEVVKDIINEKYDHRIFEMLSDGDKRIIKRFCKATKQDIDFQDTMDTEFQQRYEVLLGEFENGNNNPELKAELKRFVIEAIQENKIPRHQAYMILYQLSL